MKCSLNYDGAYLALISQLQVFPTAGGPRVPSMDTDVSCQNDVRLVLLPELDAKR